MKNITKIVYNLKSLFYIKFYGFYSYLLSIRFNYRYKLGKIQTGFKYEHCPHSEKVVFFDNFYELNRDVWNTSFPWGSGNSPNHATDGDNIKFNCHNAQFVVKHEVVTKNKTRNLSYVYTLPHLDTLNKKHFLYGIFEVKVKVSNTRGLLPAFWLLSPQHEEEIIGENYETILPEIDIFEHSGNNTNEYRDMVMSYHWGGDYKDPFHKFSPTKVTNKIDFSNDYYVFSMKWTKKYIKWYINGVLVKVHRGFVPQKEMYLVLTEYTTDDIYLYRNNLPSGMDICWVKVSEL